MKNFSWLVAVALVVACGDNGTGDETASTGADDTAGDTMNTPTGGEDESQTPPMGYEAIEAWLAAGHYKMWACETANHDARSPSPHGKNRICSNDVLSAHATQDEYPVGSAGVKEIYDAAGATIVGYAVYRHISAGTTGANWYWYERVPIEQMEPAHDANGVVADGSDVPLCVGCHMATGIDDGHSGHDFVYTQVK